MNISSFNSMNYLNSYSSNLFNSTSSSSDALTSLFTKANYYNTINKYTIANKYSNNSTASSTDTIKGTSFLSNFDSSYSSLEKASSSLKSSLKENTSDINSIVSATQKYVDAYNNTTQFLEDNSSTNTYRLNQLKSSLSAVSLAGGSALSSIGVTQNIDGTLSLNADRLKTSLTTNATTTNRALSSLTSRSDVSTQMAQNSSKSALLKEQNKKLTSSTGISSEDDISYTNFLAMSKNQLSLRNYYYGLVSSGIFMDVSL